MTGGDLHVEQAMPSYHEDIHEVLDDASSEYEEVSVTTAEELQLLSAAEIHEIEASMGGGEADGTAIVDDAHIRSHKESPQPSPQLQPPPHTDDSGIEELLGSSLESLEGDVYSNHTSHSTTEDFGGTSSNDLPDRPALVRKSSWKPQTNLHVHTYHNEDDQRKRQLEADELVSDDENDDKLHDSPKSLVDDFDADDDIDSDNESEAYSQKFKQHPTDEEDNANGDEFDDDDDDITDDEDYYGDDNSDDQSMEFFYEEYILPDKITPIRKNWKVSWFSSMHRRRMEDISEGEEEEETPDQDDGNNSEGSMSLGGTKGGKSTDLNKSWSSLDNHKRSWHSQRTARKARSDEDGSMSNGSLRNEAMGDDESMPLKLSPNQSPNSKRKRHKRGLQLDNIGEKDKETLAKEVRSKEAEEEHELNDSFRTMKRTALVKAKKKSAERKEARKKKKEKEKGKKKKKIPPPPDGATGTSMKRTKTQLPADSPKPRKKKVKEKSASTKGKVGAETQDDKSTRSKSRSKRKPKAAHPSGDEGGADPDASKSKRKTNLKVDTDVEADSSVRSASKSRRKAKTNDIEDDKNRSKSPSASKRRLKIKSKESLPTSDNQKKDKMASPKSPRRKLSKKMNKENPDDASSSSHKKKKSRSKSPKGRKDCTQPKSLSDIISPSFGNEDDEGSERTDSRRGGRRPRPQTTGEASMESRKSRKPKSMNDLKSPTQKRKKNRSNTSLKVVPEDESSNAQQQPSSLEALENMAEEKVINKVASGQTNEDNENSLRNDNTDRSPLDCSSKSAGSSVHSPRHNDDGSMDNSKLNGNDDAVDDAVGDNSAKKGGSGKKKSGFLKSFLSPRKIFKKKKKGSGDSLNIDEKATQNPTAQIDPSRLLNTETSSTNEKPSSVEKIVSNDEATEGNAGDESPVELNKIMGKLNDSFQQLNEGFATMVKTIEKVSVENPKIVVRSESSLSQSSSGANIKDDVPLESASLSKSSKSSSRAGRPMAAVADAAVPSKGKKKMPYDMSSHHDNLPALKRSQSFSVRNRSMPGMLKKSLSSASLRESSDPKKKKRSGKMTKKERSFRLSNTEWKSPLGE